MKTYTTKPDEDLGAVARKFGLPSWKYLYQINKEKIGDNPDLLKAGTVLKIPLWDSTSGDERIKKKGADPFKYTGGLRYAYPWTPVSYTITNDMKKAVADFKEPVELVVRSRGTGEIIYKGTISNHDEIEMLVPGGIEHVQLGVKGVPLNINGKTHYHPDDDPDFTGEDAENKTTG